MAKYADLIKRSKDQKEAASLELEAKKAALRVERAILDAGAQVEEAKAALTSATEANPFDIDAYIEAKRSVADAEEDLADLNALKNDLF